MHFIIENMISEKRKRHRRKDEMKWKEDTKIIIRIILENK